MALCCEYTPLSDTGRARSFFADGRVTLLLYTERAHFYHRFRIRGAREILFYAPPARASFYAELLNMMGGADAPRTTLMYTRYDGMQLEQIVGSARAGKMLAPDAAPAFMFC